MDEEVMEGADASSVETDETTDLDLGESTETTGEASTEVSDGLDLDAMVTVKVDGKTHQVPIREAINGYQRQSDYTRGMQDLADQRQHVEFGARLEEALQHDPRAAVQALVDTFDLQDMFASSTPTVDEQDDEDLEPWEQQARRVDSWIEAQEAQQFEQYTRNELAALHEDYGDFNDTELIEFMLQRQIPEFRDAFIVFANDRATAHVRRQQAEARNQQNKNGLPPVAGGTHTANGAVVGGPPEGFKTVRAAFEDAWDQASS